MLNSIVIHSTKLFIPVAREFFFPELYGSLNNSIPQWLTWLDSSSINTVDTDTGD